MNRAKTLSEMEAFNATSLLNEDYSQRYIVQLLRVSRSTVSRI